MAFCGRTNKTSVITAGILALIQSGIGLIFNIYFLALYFGYDEAQYVGANHEIFLVVTSTQFPLIRGLIIAATLLHTTWLMSSVVVLVGNSRDNINALRQWIVVTICVGIGDVVFPIVFVIYTMPLIVQADNELHEIFTIGRYYFETRETLNNVSSALWMYYSILLIGFCKLGPISLITNLFLCVFTQRRVDDLTKPDVSHVHVVTSVPVSYAPGAVQVYPVTQQYGFPTPQQHGYPMALAFYPTKPQPADTKSHDARF